MLNALKEKNPDYEGVDSLGLMSINSKTDFFQDNNLSKNEVTSILNSRKKEPGMRDLPDFGTGSKRSQSSNKNGDDPLSALNTSQIIKNSIQNDAFNFSFDGLSHTPIRKTNAKQGKDGDKTEDIKDEYSILKASKANDQAKKEGRSFFDVISRTLKKSRKYSLTQEQEEDKINKAANFFDSGYDNVNPIDAFANLDANVDMDGNDQYLNSDNKDNMTFGSQGNDQTSNFQYQSTSKKQRTNLKSLDLDKSDIKKLLQPKVVKKRLFKTIHIQMDYL